MASKFFDHLEKRCNHLIGRFLDPAIAAEQAALTAGAEMPAADFDDFAAFRLLTHAELEGYYEAKAKEYLDALDSKFRSNQAFTMQFASLVYLYLSNERKQLNWPERLRDDSASRSQDASYGKTLAQEALGFGRRFVDTNNGIKELSIHVLSSLMGYFPDELDTVLVSELNQYGRKRGDVAHASWTLNTKTFESADIERNRLIRILELTKKFYEHEQTLEAVLEQEQGS